MEEAIDLIEYAERKEWEHILHREWVAFYPHLKKPQSFKEYCDERIPVKKDIDTRPIDEIMDELMKG